MYIYIYICRAPIKGGGGDTPQLFRTLPEGADRGFGTGYGKPRRVADPL